MMWSKALTGSQAPAPVNLKRLYLCLLAVTLIIGSISLVSLLKIRSSIDELATVHDPRADWIDEMTSRLGKAQTSFHRLMNSSDHAALPNEDLDILIGELEKLDLAFSSSFSIEMKDGVYRVEGLVKLAEGAFELGRWEDLQIVMRDADQSLDKLFSLLHEERDELHQLLILKRGAILRTLWITGGLLSLSLVMCLLLAVGFYFNWKRFERAVLGI
jgi:hypothetical protein